jgi:UDPglucose 6-dehydrogenase
MKISFTNQLRMIADRFPKADVHMVLEAIGSDSRIGKKYLRAGLSYGGPCFPRDNRLVAYIARQVGLSAPLAEAADKVNQETKLDLLEKVKAQLTPHATVAVLGMSYKPDTHITEESAGLYMAQHLKEQGYRVLVHDFAANSSNSPSLLQFEMIEDISTLATRADVKLAVICCPWPQYREITFSKATRVVKVWQL